MDARAGTFQAFELLGQHLLNNQHYASDDIQMKLQELAKAREDLEKYNYFPVFVLTLSVLNGFLKNSFLFIIVKS